MDNNKIRRIGEVEIGTERPASEDYARITTLIRDHGWELHEIVLHMRNGNTVKTATLAHEDQTAKPSDFGWLVHEPTTEPSH